MQYETKQFLKAHLLAGVVAFAAYTGIHKFLDLQVQRNTPVARVILPSDSLETKTANFNQEYRFAEGYDRNGDGKIEDIKVNGQDLGKSYGSDYQGVLSKLESARNKK